MPKKKSELASFAKDGYKSLYCQVCTSYLGNTHLGEKKQREAFCSHCGVNFIQYPPSKAERNGKWGIEFGPDGSLFTSDPEKK